MFWLDARTETLSSTCMLRAYEQLKNHAIGVLLCSWGSEAVKKKDVAEALRTERVNQF